MPGLELAIGAATALGNLFSNASANAQRAGALDKYRKKLIEAQYDPVEKAKAIDRVGDLYNTNMANAMNSSAFGLGKYSNSNTAKAVSMSRMIGERSGAMVDEASKMEDYNKQIDLQIAGLELQQPVSDPLGDLVQGGAAGVQLGMSIGNYQDQLLNNKEMRDFMKGLGGTGNTNKYGKYYKQPVWNPRKFS